MLKSDLVQTDKHSIIILLRRKNLRFLRRTNHYTNTFKAITSTKHTWKRRVFVRYVLRNSFHSVCDATLDCFEPIEIIQFKKPLQLR